MTLSHKRPLLIQASRALSLSLKSRSLPQLPSGTYSFDEGEGWQSSEADDDWRGFSPEVDAPQSPPESCHGAEDIGVAFLPTQQTWQPQMPIVLAGGVAIATAIGLVYVDASQPLVEGRIQLTSTAFQGSDIVGGDEISGAIASPELLSNLSFSPSAHAEFLSTTVIPLAISQLNAQGIDISGSELEKALTVNWVDAGILEVSYQARDAHGVNQVLGAIAQTYQDQTGICQSQGCLNAQYIQTQIPHIEDELVRLKAELAAFQAQHPLADIQQQQWAVDIKVHQAMRLQDKLNEELTTAQLQLAQYYQALGIAPDTPSAQILLAQSPHYRSLMDTWQQIDRQLVTSFLSEASTSHRDDLTQRYDSTSRQIYGDIYQVATNLKLYDMPADLRYAIIENPSRVESVHAWLNHVQKIQFLVIRRNHLAQEVAHLETQTQQWRSLLAQHGRIHEQISVAMQTLADYQERYARLQQQATPQQVAWHLVAPPQIVQETTVLTEARNWVIETIVKAAHAQEP